MPRFLVSLFFVAALSLPALAGDKVRMSASASDSLSTTASCEVVSDVTASDSNARALPDQGYILRVDGELTSISSATTVTSWIALDSAGERGITQQAATTIVDEDADNTGYIAEAVNNGWVLDDDAGDAQGLYICAKTDAGTATVVWRLIWEQR